MKRDQQHPKQQQSLMSKEPVGTQQKTASRRRPRPRDLYDSPPIPSSFVDNHHAATDVLARLEEDFFAAEQETTTKKKATTCQHPAKNDEPNQDGNSRQEGRGRSAAPRTTKWQKQ